MTASAAEDDVFYERLRREAVKVNGRERRIADVRPPIKSSQRERSAVPLAPRLLALSTLIWPLVAAVPYGLDVFARVPWLGQVALVPLLPLLRFYHGSPVNGYLVIVSLYALVAKNRSLHPFVQRAGAQVATLMMVQFPANFLLQIFTGSPLLGFAKVAIFAYYAYCVALCAKACITGELASLPGIGDGGLPRTRGTAPASSAGRPMVRSSG